MRPGGDAQLRSEPAPGQGVTSFPPARGRTCADRETAAVLRIQSLASSRPVLGSALVLSGAGEHAWGPIALGLAGALLDPGRRHAWLRATAAVAGAHAVSVVLKRLVRRRRPADPRVRVLVGTPGRWGFPSSHAASTAAAAVAYGRLLGLRAPLAAVPAMMASRVIVGVHYPSDVAAGAAIGMAMGRWAAGGLPRRARP